ncbi:MAG: hypothetical protein M1454_04385 [Candidatus Thermoplasmatota archaeon]|nr:hypothetical protein [Candidatus Thermoplasmatota archaeon]MCL5730616.1 hypothetical protein [Candidatus Thermoplasmatota archaeon]
MISFEETFILSLVMGGSIFLSYPVLMLNRLKQSTLRVLNALAAGILIYLMLAIFQDVGSYFTMYTYIYDLIFAVPLFISFILIATPRELVGKSEADKAKSLSLFIALGIGFQNLTEGLVFGNSAALSLGALFVVLMFGFTIQNMTEGFPIISPFLSGRNGIRGRYIALMFFIGGAPTVIGGAVGYFFDSTYLNILFDSLAISTILFVVLEMVRGIFHSIDREVAPELRHRASAYFNIWVMIGLLLGFVVNLI